VSQGKVKQENENVSTSSPDREPLTMTPEDVAYEFSVNKRTILKWTREGKLNCIRRSKKIIRFSREYINSVVVSGIGDITSGPTPNKNKIWVTNSSTQKKKGKNRTSRESSWRNLREEVTKCQ
jgi:hypothetical protein